MKLRCIPKSVKILLWTVGGFIGLLASLNIVAWLFLDVQAYQPRLVAAISKALDMDVEVDGRLGFRLLPALSVSLPNARLSQRGSEILFAQQARFGVALLPLLLRREIRVDAVSLKNPRLSLERGPDGKFNFEKPDGDKVKTLPPLDLARLQLSNGVVSYHDQASGRGFQAAKCNVQSRGLRLAGGKAAGALKRLALRGEIACGELRVQKLVVSDLKLSVTGKKGVFQLAPVTMRLLAGRGEGSLRADFSGVLPQYRWRYRLTNFRVEELFAAVSAAPVIQGAMDLRAELATRGRGLEEIKKHLQGEISLRGNHLTYEGTDLDRELAQFESSQRFNLADAGAFFLAGPFGLAVTKGYSFANVLGDTGGRSAIPRAVSDWEIQQGVARARDVAFVTQAYRIALQGKLDFTQDRLEDIEMALVDEQGCAQARQKISGSFQQPAVERSNAIKTLAGPALNLFKMFPGKKTCEVFYTGSVPAPKKTQAMPDKAASE